MPGTFWYEAGWRKWFPSLSEDPRTESETGGLFCWHGTKDQLPCEWRQNWRMLHQVTGPPILILMVIVHVDCQPLGNKFYKYMLSICNVMEKLVVMVKYKVTWLTHVWFYLSFISLGNLPGCREREMHPVASSKQVQFQCHFFKANAETLK